MRRIDAEVDGDRRDALVGARESVGLCFNLQTHLFEVHKLAALTVQELCVLCRERRQSISRTDWECFQPTQVCNVPALLLTSWRMRGRRVTMPEPLGKKSLEDAQSLTRTSSKQHIRLKVATIDTFLLVIHFSASSNTDEPVCIIDRRIDFQTCLL